MAEKCALSYLSVQNVAKMELSPKIPIVEESDVNTIPSQLQICVGIIEDFQKSKPHDLNHLY